MLVGLSVWIACFFTREAFSRNQISYALDLHDGDKDMYKQINKYLKKRPFMVDERVGLCGACESACESEPSKRFRVLRHHPARMSWHWPLCKTTYYFTSTIRTTLHYLALPLLLSIAAGPFSNRSKYAYLSVSPKRSRDAQRPHSSNRNRAAGHQPPRPSRAGQRITTTLGQAEKIYT